MNPRVHVIPVALATIPLLVASCGGGSHEIPGNDAFRAGEHAEGYTSSASGDPKRPTPHEGEPGPESKLTLPKEKWVDPRAGGY